MKLLKGLLVITLISLITVSCNNTKKEVEKDLKETVEATEEAVGDVVEATEEVVSDAVEEVAADVVSWVDIPVVYPKDTKLEKQVFETKAVMAKGNPNVEKIFGSTYGYAIFPKITKGGLIIGGAGGHGLVFVGNTVVGSSTLMQATIGAQAGGQQYAEFILFEDKAAMDRFRNNKFKFAGDVSAVAWDKGVSEDINYQNGVAVYTQANKGLMAVAALGTQKFKYKDGIN